MAHTHWIKQRNYIDSLPIEDHPLIGNYNFSLNLSPKSLEITDVLFNIPKVL
ncbi:hypothetical protein J595_02703 [Acinetobacter sp. 1592897]|nr:hypothetical protein ACINWC487_2864 [Acinetobacter nosocomialis]EXB13166.1 hypothetical protein J514_1523 [Acinetobacter sp. 1396970]EXE98657.1 hypothetical protein J594_2348 [Acinetobacter sp. 259052]EXI11844.1 hypothetical protein J604_2028 [Acinetobacter sp. 694762]EXS47640.1 hypothetical protein J660_0573 [Acinetobacter sp. 88816]EYT15694.1 hypothetical protein J595_02703 [Acinetobacter sp. 1592897]KCX95491.1 hypothetical protein J568_0021 [Acinetobacter baumannii 6112]